MMNREEAIKRLEVMATNLVGAAEHIMRKIRAIDETIAALREQEQSKWISVKDRLPEEKGSYLAYVKTYNKWGGYTKVTWFTPCYEGVEDHLQGKQIWYDYYDSEWGDYEVRDVTHWMPLPEPPKEGADHE